MASVVKICLHFVFKKNPRQTYKLRTTHGRKMRWRWWGSKEQRVARRGPVKAIVRRKKLSGTTSTTTEREEGDTHCSRRLPPLVLQLVLPLDQGGGRSWDDGCLCREDEGGEGCGGEQGEADGTGRQHAQATAGRGWRWLAEWSGVEWRRPARRPAPNERNQARAGPSGGPCGEIGARGRSGLMDVPPKYD